MNSKNSFTSEQKQAGSTLGGGQKRIDSQHKKEINCRERLHFC